MTLEPNMYWKAGRRLALGVAVAACASALIPVAQAQDFFSQLFSGFGDRPQTRSIQLPFMGEGNSSAAPGEVRRGGGGLAYCVRTCDGRYFPVSGSDGQSRAATCNSFCPASETKVFYGSSIDHAAAENGKAYSSLPNAFRYRKELVAGCTCNGKDQIGLAPVKIENDPTLRKGDIVAGPDGLMVAGRSADKRGAALNFSPASDSVRSKYQRIPVVARE
jgi:hypothetical protein